MSITIKVDGTLPALAMALGELKQSTRDTILRQSISDGIRAGAEEARRGIVKRGGFDRVGLAGEVRRSIDWRYLGNGQGWIRGRTSKWHSLAHKGWASSTDPKGDYRRGGLRGVRIRGHVTDRNWFALNSKKAFVRTGANGNVHVFRRLEGRKIEPLRAIAPAHILHHYEVFDKVEKKAHDTISKRYLSKYDYKVRQLKSKYGL